ncbi:EEF1A lysine methyltransferase 4-like [Dendrobium catenatum]|uniref:EEF1A lysine methyltransferase 4-like n=1 Tax=Dendrobium catenatum TaxID=906689 RepID=UPI00109F9837|nr:EEF1A lysine methyltransferase 4-like [Dendrobium catenatum]
MLPIYYSDLRPTESYLLPNSPLRSSPAMAFDDQATPNDGGRKETAPEFLPKTTSAYGDPRYWDERFLAEEHYEWLKEYSYFQHLIRPYISTNYSILELGCGNSRLSERLHGEGVMDITCIDISAIAVERMRQRLKEKGLLGIQVVEADMHDLPFESESFDIVVEKGTMVSDGIFLVHLV